MGLGSALHLAEAGCTVTVLEKEESVAKARKQGHKQRRKNVQTQFSLSKVDGLQHQWCDALSFTLRLLGKLQIFVKGKFTITWQWQRQDPSPRERESWTGKLVAIIEELN